MPMIQTLMQIALGIMVAAIIVTLFKAGRPSRAKVEVNDDDNLE